MGFHDFVQNQTINVFINHHIDPEIGPWGTFHEHFFHHNSNSMEIRLTIFSFQLMISLQSFVHAPTAPLSWHEKIEISSSFEFGWEQHDEINLEFVSRLKNHHQGMRVWTVSPDMHPCALLGAGAYTTCGIHLLPPPNGEGYAFFSVGLSVS